MCDLAGGEEDGHAHGAPAAPGEAGGRGLHAHDAAGLDVLAPDLGRRVPRVNTISFLRIKQNILK